MELLPIIVILIHPFAALLLIMIFMTQLKWRKKREFLKGDDLIKAHRKHISDGNKIMLATIFVIVLAFIGEISRAIFNNLPFDSYIMPNNFHSSGGLLGLLLMIILWLTGHSTQRKKVSNQSFSKTRDTHGRIGDIMAILILIHAFLGFLYLLQII
ncbi:MAG: hypothetical protein HOJ64_06220 [Euryarchaeota archaeon]|jgi:hypothetical protein|nr:hypothetical protein [Euryarchaeota archaeon]MBT4391622.1 hypothetical protein [Euryarchaeota archaeon]MBT4802798.1 hypothetical protein [Euryarchaeota archaeon]MBT5614451.1 hypothetical protein [Euryarchaeota archaeon]MBT6684296.1 hypothetical protein [Euryarchaeota archaeon]